MVNCCLVVCEFVKRCLIDAVERSRGCLYTTSRPACFQVFLDPDLFGKRTQRSTLNFPEMDTRRLDLVPSASEQRKNGLRAVCAKETTRLPSPRSLPLVQTNVPACSILFWDMEAPMRLLVKIKCSP